MNTFVLSANQSFPSAFNVPRFKTILIHLAIWVAYYLYEVLYIMLLPQVPFPHPIESILVFSCYALLVYGNSDWLFPRYFMAKRYREYAVGLSFIILLYFALRYLISAIIVPNLSIHATYPYGSFTQLIVYSFYRGVIFFGYGLTYCYVKYVLHMQQQVREHQQQLFLQERGLLEADIAFLKSQINPHFLFNALNFLYAQVYPLSEPTAKSVLLLSDIMRYALNEGGEQGKVMLDKELQHLRNYLALNQLRFGNTLQVQFEVSGSTQFLLILPLVLITFVENCFKHGELFDPAHPVLIQVRVQENQLTFFTSNRKRTGPVEVSTGIGLDNTRRRLQAIYPNRHQLTLHDELTSYTTHLHLIL